MDPSNPINGKGLLTPLQQSFLVFFSTLPDQGQYYLTGGTALAEFYLGHRLSFDLDLFTGVSNLVLPMSYQIEKNSQTRFQEVRVVRRYTTYVEFQFTDGDEELRVDLALDSPYRFTEPKQSAYGVLINDRLDLYVDKLLVYYGRAEPRDAVDLSYILKESQINELLSLAAKKDPGFDLYWFAVALNRSNEFPDEIERWPIKMVKPFEPRELKMEFQTLAVDIMNRINS